MRLINLLSILTILLLTATACNKKEQIVKFEPEKDDLVITIQDQFVAPPSRVSVFFKVETKEGDPVSGLTEDNFTIYEKGRNDDDPRLISADEATRTISDNSVVFQNRSILLLDLSGSVLNNSLEELKQGANEFIDNVITGEGNTSNSIGIWWFDGKDALHTLIDFTNDADALHDAVNSVSQGLSNDSSTDLFGAILKGVNLAESKVEESDIQGILSAVSIVVFTDGTDQAARYSREDAYAAVNTASEEIKFYTIGLGSEIDETVLKNIGKTSSVFASDTAALTAKFEEIAQLIYDAANSFYLFEYCTPKRDGSGINELHIHVKRDNKTGDRITTFDATGFSEDCDLQ